jgi:hypothetical protein
MSAHRTSPIHPDSAIIDALGGTSATARLCAVKPSAVSQWRHVGIPDARLMYLRLARPKAFRAKKPAETA